MHGSVTAITVYQDDSPALVIQHFVPFSTHLPPSSTARQRIDAVSEPASRSDSAYDADTSPEAMAGSTSRQASNTTARLLYDKMAVNRGFIRYDIELA